MTLIKARIEVPRAAARENSIYCDGRAVTMKNCRALIRRAGRCSKVYLDTCLLPTKCISIEIKGRMIYHGMIEHRLDFAERNIDNENYLTNVIELQVEPALRSRKLIRERKN